MKRGLLRTDALLLRRMGHEVRPYRFHLGAIFAISMLAAPLALLLPVPLAIAVDSAIGSKPLPGFVDVIVPAGLADSSDGILVFAALMFLLVAVLTQLQDLTSTVLKTYTGERLVLDFQGKLFQQAQRLSLAYHDRVGTSDSTYRVQQDARSLQYIAVESLISIVTAFTTLAAMIYVTARIDVPLALIALAISPLLLLAARHYRPRLRETSREVKKLESGALSVVQEVLTGLRVVKAFGREDTEQDRFVGRSGAGMRARVRLRMIEGAYALLVGAIIGIGGSAVLYVGVKAVQSGRISLGELLLVMGYLTQLYAPIKMMARKAGSLQNHLASAERCFALLDEAPDVPARTDARPLARARGAVEFCDVSFGYEPGRPVLEDVSFAVQPGTRVGIAGATGAGKTTLLSLLARFYDPGTGHISLDGVDLRDYRLADLRNQFGIVLQEPVLFSTTIYENIAYARPKASPEEVEAAAAAAGIHDFIARLPDGYETQVRERGMGLSGGERQRISLARAFLKDAPILILDEPTSAVDVETEAAIMEAMERLMSGRTSFMIAHRLSTLEGCDLRLELDHGRVVTPPRSNLPRIPDRVPAQELPDHPAVSAWLAIGGARPQGVAVLKSKRHRKRGVYRLEGAGPRGAPVIAKICKRKIADVEAAVYERLLPALPVPRLDYYGKLDAGDRQHCWLFMEDAGSQSYSPIRQDHRRLAAHWLAAVQVHAAEFAQTSDLPDRGPRHYLVHLFSSRDEVTRQLRRADRGTESGRVLADLLLKLERLESGWDELTRFYDTLPRTLVHGDLVPKNLRIAHNGRFRGLTVFDWEMAGIGVQTADLAQLPPPERLSLARPRHSKRVHRFSANPCLDTYRSALGALGTKVEMEALAEAAAVGNVFRCLAGIDWACMQATADWFPLDDLRVQSEWLDAALRGVGWDAPAHTFMAAR
jgi:ATP-binding cassette subfamily B protein